MTLDDIRALVVPIKDFPKIPWRLGERMIDIPEGVEEDLQEYGPPPGFASVEQFHDLWDLHDKLRAELTNGVVEALGPNDVWSLLDEIFLDDDKSPYWNGAGEWADFVPDDADDERED